jgi:UDP-N-acetylmuramoylalanine--D-glutamate ligase
MDLAGKKVVVVGMAKSGTAAVKLLLAKGAEVRAVDEKPQPPVLGVPVLPQAEESFGRPDLVVISPGVPADLAILEALRARGIPVIGELELAAPFLQGGNIGVTGTNGKTTTTALTGHILREAGIASQVGGNIGTPLTAMVETSRPDQWNVLELSSFQLETVQSFHAPIAACLNMTQNHLDRHHTFENYVNAKARLFETQRAGDLAVLNADDPVTAGLAKRTPAQTVWFSGTHPASGAWLDQDYILLEGERLLNVRELRLRGRHNYENVMAAALDRRSRRGEARANRQARRQPLLRLSIAWNWCANSTASAITTIPRPPAWMPRSKPSALSTADCGSSWAARTKTATTPSCAIRLRAKARAALLIGKAASKIAKHLGDDAVPILLCGTLAAAVDRAYQSARPGDTVLLAPACSSFDQFESYEHRGRVFKELVQGSGRRERP